MTRLGRDGGDVPAVEVVLVAVAGGPIETALEGINGLEGKAAIDATNLYGGATPPDGHASNARDRQRWRMGQSFYRFAPPARF